MLVCVTEARGRRWNNGRATESSPSPTRTMCTRYYTPVASRLRVKKCLFFLDIVQQSRYLVALWGQNGLQKWQIS